MAPAPKRVPMRALLVALALTLGLGGCGWQLRGSYSLPPEIVPVSVTGGGIAGELRRNLRRIGADAGGQPASRLEILEENDRRRVFSVGTDGKVDVFEVIYTVRWQLTAPASDGNATRVLIAPRAMRATRRFEFDSAATLSKDEEEEARVETMRRDMVQRILNQLQAWRPAEGDGVTE